jgi:dihydrofolate reductase
MKFSVFIATSADGYIATKSGDISWLEQAGDKDVDMGNLADMNFATYLSTVDCMVMGRKCMEKISSFNLSSDQWPYGEIPIYALSKTLSEAPENLKGKVTMYSGEIPDLVKLLKEAGVRSVYVDGGTTITSFLNFGLINEMTITRAPILLGEGIPLFGKTKSPIRLSNAQVKAYPNNFIQVKYEVNYDV